MCASQKNCIVVETGGQQKRLNKNILNIEQAYKSKGTR